VCVCACACVRLPFPVSVHVDVSCACMSVFVCLCVWVAQIVTPWDVEADDEGGIDYDKLIDRFGSQRISDDLIARMERLTGKKAYVSSPNHSTILARTHKHSTLHSRRFIRLHTYHACTPTTRPPLVSDPLAGAGILGCGAESFSRTATSSSFSTCTRRRSPFISTLGGAPRLMRCTWVSSFSKVLYTMNKQ